MKKIMLAAVAASFMSTGAHAVQLPAEGQVCSDIHSNITSGINVVELSDYRKCVMIQHDIDTAFTYKTFWVRNGDMFTSFPVETLAKMNRGERIDYMMVAIQQSVAIKSLEDQRDALIIKRDSLIADLDDKKAHLADTLKMLSEANSKLMSINEALDSIDLDNAKVKIVFDAGAASVDITSDNQMVRDAIFSDINGRLAAEGYNSVSTIAELEVRVREIAKDAGDAAVAGIFTDINSRLIAEGYAPVASVEALDTRVRQIVENEIKNARDRVDLSVAGINDGSNLTINDLVTLKNGHEYTTATFGSNVHAFVTVTSPEITKRIYVGNLTSVMTYIQNDRFDLAASSLGYRVAAAFASGYETGYKNGYDDGYDDGYADGFRDGVDSVK